MAVSSDIIRGHLDAIILKLIIEKDRYAYEISNEIRQRTQEAFSIKEATLYALVQRLEKKDLISSYMGTKSHGSKRRYYKITTLGKAYFKERIKEWETLNTVMTQLLEVSNARD